MGFSGSRMNCLFHSRPIILLLILVLIARSARLAVLNYHFHVILLPKHHHLTGREVTRLSRGCWVMGYVTRGHSNRFRPTSFSPSHWELETPELIIGYSQREIVHSSSRFRTAGTPTSCRSARPRPKSKRMGGLQP